MMAILVCTYATAKDDEYWVYLVDCVICSSKGCDKSDYPRFTIVNEKKQVVKIAVYENRLDMFEFGGKDGKCKVNNNLTFECEKRYASQGSKVLLKLSQDKKGNTTFSNNVQNLKDGRLEVITASCKPDMFEAMFKTRIGGNGR